MSQLMAAAAYAAEKHAFQVRKGRAGAPYVNHVLDVAQRLEAAHPGDTVLVIGGLLHDVIEDCSDWTGDDHARTPEAVGREIEGRFGAEVAALVWEVTDDKTLDKDVRKARQVETVAGKSVLAKRLKFADKTSNVTALAESPPDWPLERQRAYLDWAEKVLAGARGVSPRLETEFDAALARTRSTLGAPA